MINIKEVAKTMTKEEFLKEASKTNFGKFNDGDDCPTNYHFKKTDDCRGFNAQACEECWRNAVKDIKFKDDIEVKKLSKELNIIEAIKMPIGAEFKIKYDNGCVDSSKVVLRELNGFKSFIWKASNSIVIVKENVLNATLISIQKPVTFMEALESGKKVKVKCEGYLDIDKNYYLISEIFEKIIKGNEVFGENETEKAIKSFITNGQWYIHEDNAND